MVRHFLATAALGLALVAPVAAAQTASVSFELTNRTGHTLTHIYISLPSSDSWEEDILGDQVVRNGETVEISVDDGLEACEYDILYDFSDGESLVEESVDLCAIDGEAYTVQ
jgi:hypothetical protein